MGLCSQTQGRNASLPYPLSPPCPALLPFFPLPPLQPMASLITAQLLFLEAENPDKPCYMYINSPGGIVTAGLAIYDTMQYIRPPVATICMGQVGRDGTEGRREKGREGGRDDADTHFMYSGHSTPPSQGGMPRKQCMHSEHSTPPSLPPFLPPSQASSMGSLLLTAGEPGMRMALPNSKIMLHQVNPPSLPPSLPFFYQQSLPFSFFSSLPLPPRSVRLLS